VLPRLGGPGSQKLALVSQLDSAAAQFLDIILRIANHALVGSGADALADRPLPFLQLASTSWHMPSMLLNSNRTRLSVSKPS